MLALLRASIQYTKKKTKKKKTYKHKKYQSQGGRAERDHESREQGTGHNDEEEEQRGNVVFFVFELRF